MDWVEGISNTTKRAIAELGERIVRQIFVPRYLPQIRMTEFNYPIAIGSKWRGRSYVFFTRYRPGFAENRGEEFDAPFSRIEYAGAERWNVGWYRHTGRWFTVERNLPLSAALRAIETQELLHPHI